MATFGVKLAVGDPVTVLGKKCNGVVAYIGELEGKEGNFYGVKLSQPIGKNDGSLQGKRYFQCEQKHGTFVRIENLSLRSKACHPGKGGNSYLSKFKHSAAKSHEQNEACMANFEKGLEHLSLSNNSCRALEGKHQHQDLDPTAIESRFTSTDFNSASTSDYAASTVKYDKIWGNGPRNPEGVLFDASNLPLLCSAVSPSGTECVVGGSDHGLRVFDVLTGKEKRNLYTKQYGHSDWVTSVAYCPDGAILSAGMDKKLCLWSSSGVRCVNLESHTHSVSKVKVSASGSHAVSSSYDKTVKIWMLRGRKRGQVAATLMGHKAPVLDFAFSGGYILSGARDGVAMAWDMETGNASVSLGKHSGHVTSLECVLDSGSQKQDQKTMIVATGDQAGTLRIWDLRTAQNAAITKQAHPGGAINEMAYSSSTCTFVTAGADKSILINDARMNMRTLATFDSHKDFIYSLRLADRFVFTGSGDGMLLVHDIKKGELLYGLGANTAGIRCIEVTEQVLIAAGDDGNAITYTFE